MTLTSTYFKVKPPIFYFYFYLYKIIFKRKFFCLLQLLLTKILNYCNFYTIIIFYKNKKNKKSKIKIWDNKAFTILGVNV